MLTLLRRLLRALRPAPPPPAPTDALAELRAALLRGDTLPWLVRWCPDGDLDAAVRRAWESCGDLVALAMLRAAFDALPVWVAIAIQVGHGSPDEKCVVYRTRVACP